MFGTVAPGWGRVQAVCDLVHQHIKFDYLRARSELASGIWTVG
jgi:hypothetical protein